MNNENEIKEGETYWHRTRRMFVKVLKVIGEYVRFEYTETGETGESHKSKLLGIDESAEDDR